MSSTDRRAERLEDLAAEIGLSVRAWRAQTGTIYLACEHPRCSRRATIRVADHADAYATADYSADGVEGDDAGARRALLALRGTPPAALRRLRAWRRGREARRVARARAEWIAGYAIQRGITEAEAERLCPIR
jgi:hypothetical protein